MDRNEWLDVDFGIAAAAASSCAMFKSALLFLELQAAQVILQSTKPSRRSSSAYSEGSLDILRQIYQSLDDPDFFYGVKEAASLESVMSKLRHEGDKTKNLSVQSAAFDSHMKSSRVDDHSEFVEALVAANMNGAARAVNAHQTPEIGQRRDASNSASLTALNLHQWNISIPSSTSDPSSLLFHVFRHTNISANLAEVSKGIDNALLILTKSIVNEGGNRNALRQSIATLAALTETKEAISSRGFDELEACWSRLERRERWQETEECVLHPFPRHLLSAIFKL